MAVKRCPSCQQTLPVACKSCPCGHVFITKKCHASKDSGDEKKERLPLKRLRPERPKREIPDYEYHDVYARACLNGDSQGLTLIPKRMKLFCENDDDDDNFSFVGHDAFERSDSIEDGILRPKKKRGRPKGSKNKPKALLAGMARENDYNDDQHSQLFSNVPRKPGRPKGSKNRINPDLDDETAPIQVQAKTNMLPPIPQEKLVMYSLILSDINERLMSQNKIKRLPGI